MTKEKKAPPKKNNPDPSPPEAKRSSFKVILLGLGLGLGGGILYHLFALHTEIVFLKKQTLELNQLVKKQQKALGEFNDFEQKTQENLATLKQSLHSAQEQIGQIHLPNDLSQLSLQLTKDYIQEAHLYLTVGLFPQMTLELLNHAKTQLTPVQTQFPALFEALSEDIEALKTQPLDNELQMQTLDKLMNEIPGLPFASGQPLQMDAWIPSKMISPKLKTVLETNLKKLEQLIIIRHQEVMDLPWTLTPFQAIIKEALGLKLLECQWAFMTQNKSRYDATLAESIALSKRYFLKTSPKTLGFIQTLQDLATTSLKHKNNEGLKSYQLITSLPQEEPIN